MLRRAASLAVLLAAGALASCAIVEPWRAPAAPPPTPVHSSTWKEPPKGYLPEGGHPDGMKILPPPPAVGSPQQLGELDVFRTTRALEGSPRWVQAIRDADLSGTEAFRGFSCAAGVRIGPDTTPTLARMLMRLIHDGRPVYNPPKDHYARKRPAAGNDAPICVPRESWIETNGSYPSGHALIGYSWGLILAELVPDRSTELVARGREFGESRMICGVHWPSDIEGGRILAGALVARLHADPGFQADLAAARSEVEAARGLGAPAQCPGA